MPLYRGGVLAHAEGQSTPLPSTWANIANIEGRWYGSYLNIDQSRKLNVTYKVQNNVAEKGQTVDPSHITNQYVVYNGQRYDSVKDFSADKIGSGELVTTWDNGKTEKDGFIFWTYVTVNYWDIDSPGTALANMKSKWTGEYLDLKTKTYAPYDLSEYDKATITTADGRVYKEKSIVDNSTGKACSLTGNTSELTGQKDIIIYYKRQVTVSYDANGGSGKMDPETVDLNATVKTKANAFKAPEGKTFAGWNTKADGSGTAYAADKDLKVSDDMTLYAQWETKKPTVTPSQNNQKIQTVKSTGVKTGDATQAMPFVTAMGAALAAVIVLAAKRRHFE